MTQSPLNAGQAATWVRDQLPATGLFQDQQWRVSPEPFLLEPSLVSELESLGRVLLQFYKAIHLLYRHSVGGKQPSWVSELYDQGKPEQLIAWQREPAFKIDLPRVIRPDLLLTDTGFAMTELDSVPGGIGLTAWLNSTYASLPNPPSPWQIIGEKRGMIEGFESIFGAEGQVHIVVSEESASYRPEMKWLSQQIPSGRFKVQDATFSGWANGDSIYRFFELFDLGNVPHAESMIQAGLEKRLRLTAPFKPCLEEKLSLALLWNRNLRSFWRQELGEGFLNRLLRHVPYSWVVDPTPLPPHGAIPELNLTDWRQLETLSQKERDLILKVSGYSEEAWGARGVYLGSDLPQAEWSVAVQRALQEFPKRPYVLQRYHKPRVVDSGYFDFEKDQWTPMPSRVRLCPYYFVTGDGDQARTRLGGVLATACPADKKIIHGMRDAVLMPCAVSANRTV